MGHIEAIKQLVEKPTRPSNQQLLNLISVAEIGKEDFLSLDSPHDRQVVLRQCAAVNAKLMMLKNTRPQTSCLRDCRILR